MLSLRIVTHAYAKTLPQYAVFLRAQLTSVLKFSPVTVQTRISVCCAADDVRVLRVVEDFAPKLGSRLHVIVMPEGELFRRSIGRNKVALSATEDMVFFTDVDHVFGPGCIQGLRDQLAAIEGPVFAWPNWLWIQAAHKLGDDFVKDNLDTRGLIQLDELGIPEFHNEQPSAAFEKKKYGRAIGGVQIVSGSFARDHGYLNADSKWQTPRTDGKPFGDFTDDVKFRKFCLARLNAAQLEIPQLYRLRHTAVTYKG